MCVKDRPVSSDDALVPHPKAVDAAKMPTGALLLLPPQTHKGSEAFIDILMHSLNCRNGCSSKPCMKMGMVLGHYNHCRLDRRRTMGCQVCRQFLKIIAQHSLRHCGWPVGSSGCPVPTCDAMRMAAAAKRSAAAAKAQSVRQVRAVRGLVCSKPLPI